MLSSFIKIFFLTLIFFAVSKAQTPAPTSTPNDDTERIETEEIKLNVSAVDSNGRFVPDVKKEDLVISEDNRLHQASSLRRIPANVLILLDMGGEMRRAKSFDQTKKIAKSLIDALHAEDSVAIMQYSDKVELIAEWTNKENALNILKTKANFGKRSVFVDALEKATDFLQKTSLDNRHLVLVTDGTDTFNNLTERNAAMKKLLATDINVHVFSYTQMERAEIAPNSGKYKKGEPKPQRLPEEVIIALPREQQTMLRLPRLDSIVTDKEFLKKMKERENALLESEKYLTELSRDTNGEIVLPATNEEMIEKTALVAAIIDSSYVLTYVPKRPLSESAAGETRNIEVTSRRPDLQVQARRKLIVEPQK